MVHSIFADPATLAAESNRHHSSAFGTMSKADHAKHVAMGHIPPTPFESATQRATETGKDDPCAERPTARSLPQEMLINVAGVSAVFEPVHVPCLAISTDPPSVLEQAPASIAPRVDVPPPR